MKTDTERVITENFIYDHQNRLLVHKHQVDSNPEEILAQNKYNELSQLESKKVGGVSLGSALQTVDYKYNIRGWMTQINDPVNLGNDLFGYKINYNQVEGLEVPNADYPDLKVKPRYNGNIAEVSWKTRTEENEALKRYGYTYDSLNRLSAGFYQKAGNESAKEYFEKLEYDFNGNITRLKRSAGLPAGNTTALAIDNLRYDYTGNKLIRVTDEQQNTSGYPYVATPGVIGYDNDTGDGNGNMISHPDKGISSIQYNYLNLPQQVIQNSAVTKYTYRADGIKVKKLFKDIETDYLDGFQYKSTKPSEGNSGGLVVVDPNEVAVIKLRIIPTSEGYFDTVINQYIYNFTDHLGNVRLSYSDSNKDGFIQPRQYFWQECETPQSPWDVPNCIDGWKPGEIVEVNNYYPFGLLHNYTATTQNAYQYKYNGKELQETGMYDYGARMYMPDIGRWGVIDPLAFLYFQKSPYNYAANNPIMFVDPNGKHIIGSTKEDAKKAQEDINKVFADKRFDNFRTLISIKGKTFNQIDETKLKNALSNSDLSADDKTLMETVANTINSKDEHLVEYVGEKDNVSSKAVEAFGIPSYLNKDKMQEKFGGIPASIYAAGGGSVTGKTKKGTFSLIVSGISGASDYKDQNGNYVASPIGREGTTGHEVLGHGRSLMTGRGDVNQHQDAVKLENLILRVMGHTTIQRDGTDHGPKTTISNASALPEYK
ncbi:RHS repeat domain-containing protein [Chryseobacterium vrystaatense]|uniref:RHS repeat-associated core domain-containing protein n=1 Tax=Chryseobacterium vrystaatense TaxID=307480 RepID=A0ABR4UG69_9FLAO|nr:RHS repeat-associated core domain-containing protein [Chryseobacterium vrystaatense]KFF23444.1 hypothetical protein IW16_24580 [Chryseobacterium vrystaatense]